MGWCLEVERSTQGEDRAACWQVVALAARSQICRDLILHDLVLGAAEAFLAPFTKKIILHSCFTYLNDTDTISIFFHFSSRVENGISFQIKNDSMTICIRI